MPLHGHALVSWARTHVQPAVTVLLKEYLPGAKSVACNEVQVRSCRHDTNAAPALHAMQHMCLYVMDARKQSRDLGPRFCLQAHYMLEAEQTYSTHAPYLHTTAAHGGCAGVE
jgi:hypothetical protein